MSSWYLIANPKAGGGKAYKTAIAAAQTLQQRGQPVELLFTQAKGHGTELTRQAVAAGAPRVLLCGGDGTLAEALPILASSSTILGILPLGTGNDFARAIGLKPGNIAHALDLQFNGSIGSLDLGYAAGRYFSTVATFGFDAEISQAMAQNKLPFSGTPGYILGALQLLMTYSPMTVKIEGEFGSIKDKLFLVAGANTSSYGGGLKIAPSADPTDGKFDICILQPVTRWTAITQLMPRLFMARHVHHPAVSIKRSSWLSIHTNTPQAIYADGEYLSQTPIKLEIKPRILRVVLPKS